MSELSIGRDPDGDVNFEIYLDKGNLVSVSIHKDGTLNWAGGSNAVFVHGNVPPSDLGRLLFALIDRSAVSETEQQP